MMGGAVNVIDVPSVVLLEGMGAIGPVNNTVGHKPGDSDNSVFDKDTA